MKAQLPGKSLLDGYRIPGFRTRARVKGRFGDRSALVVTLSRLQKKRRVVCVERCIARSMIAVLDRLGTSVPVADECIWNSMFDGWIAGHVVQ